MKKLLDLKLFGLVAILTVALVFIGVDFMESQVKTQDKPPAPPGNPGNPNQGGHKTHDLPAVAVFGNGADALTSDEDGAYIDGEYRVTCFIGRQSGAFVLQTSHKFTTGRTLCVSCCEQEENPPCPCRFPFDGCRVADMFTGGATNMKFLPKGEDFRFMPKTDPQVTYVVPVQLVLYNNRQNLWLLQYGVLENDVLVGGVQVTPVGWDDNRDANGDELADAVAWEITTGGSKGSPTAAVIWNPWWQNPIPYGDYDVPFHLTVTLQ